MICHCGHPENFHNFRHAFTPISTVKRSISEGKTTIEIYAKNFPVKTKTKCAVKECSVIKGFHDIKLVSHDFIPVIIPYKEINLVLFGNEICNVCECSLEKHSKLDLKTHSFTTNVVVVGKEENDTVSVIYYDDEDTKIIFQ